MGDESIAKLFDKVDEINVRLGENNERLLTLEIILREKEKTCNAQRGEIEDHDKRLDKLERWRYRQEGAGGLVLKWVPIIVSVITFGFLVTNFMKG